MRSRCRSECRGLPDGGSILCGGMRGNMRNIKIGLIIILSILTVGLCGILLYGMTGGTAHNMFMNSGHQNYADMQMVLEEEVSPDGIDSISVLYGMNSNDIYIYESENDAVLVREYSSTELSDNEITTVRVNDGSLEVRGARRNNADFGFHLFYFDNRGHFNRHYTEVYIPASYRGGLLLETSSGDIVSDKNIESEKDFSVTSSSGDVHFLSVTAANISVTTSSGYIKIEDIDTSESDSDGKINMKTSSGDVNLGELTGETRIESSSGNLTVQAISGDAQLKTTSGDMNLKELAGETKLESSSGYLSVEIISGNATLKTSSGDVTVQHIDGDLQAVTSSGYVRILEGSGDRSISTNSGDVTVEGAEGSFQVDSSSGDVQITIQKGEGRIGTTSGDVRLDLKELAGALNINSSSGYVNVKLPAENEFEFEANTASGDIVTFFDDELQMSSKKDHAQGAHGTNTQGNRMEIRTSSGDVRIMKY